MSNRIVRSALAGICVAALLSLIMWAKFHDLNQQGFAGGNLPGAFAMSALAGMATAYLYWHGLVDDTHHVLLRVRTGAHSGSEIGKSKISPIIARLAGAAFWGPLGFVVAYILTRGRGGNSQLFGYDPNAALQVAFCAAGVSATIAFLVFYANGKKTS